MFYVFNKSKIYSYMIAVCTVVILFMAAGAINDMVTPSQNSVGTGTNVVRADKVKTNEIKMNVIETDDIKNMIVSE